MDEAASVSYQLTEAAYSANELGETWVQRMLAVLMACFGFVQPLLAPTLHDTLIDNVLDKVRFLCAPHCVLLVFVLLCTAVLAVWL